MNKPEEQHCIAFANWLDFQGLKFTHIVNEVGGAVRNRKFAMIEGVRLKKMGKSSGVPDYVILTHKGTLWVEMKDPSKKLKKGNVMEGWKEGQKKRGGLSAEQKEWIEAINEVPNAQAEVCYGADEAIAFVERILKTNDVNK